MNFTYVRNQFQCDELVEYLLGQEVIAVDTEFMSTTTYYPRVVLIQISSKNNVFIIDPLDNSLNISGVIGILKNESILKIIHAAHHDMRALYHSYKIVVKNIFDLQIAAKYCLNKSQISYAELVNKYCNINIAKRLQNSNWSRRPLSSAQIEYAANDVKFGITIYHHLLSQLNSMPCGVIVNYQADLLKIEQDLVKNIEPISSAKIKKKIKSIQSFYGKTVSFSADEISMMSEFLFFRERVAMIRDISPQIVISNQDIVNAIIVRRITDKEETFFMNTKINGYLDVEKVTKIMRLTK